MVVKLQPFTECQCKCYDVTYCDITERFEMTSLYWGTQDKPGLEVCTVHFAVASKHIRSKVKRFFFNIFEFSKNNGFGSFFFRRS